MTIPTRRPRRRGGNTGVQTVEADVGGWVWGRERDGLVLMKHNRKYGPSMFHVGRP